MAGRSTVNAPGQSAKGIGGTSLILTLPLLES